MGGGLTLILRRLHVRQPERDFKWPFRPRRGGGRGGGGTASVVSERGVYAGADDEVSPDGEACDVSDMVMRKNEPEQVREKPDERGYKSARGSGQSSWPGLSVVLLWLMEWC